MKRGSLVLLLIGCVGAAGCDSPEATRIRGGGPGADVGNRSRTVEMHGGSRPFWRTPERITGEHPSLEPAQQAYELNRR
jgi:hypothetical protein